VVDDPTPAVQVAGPDAKQTQVLGGRKAGLVQKGGDLFQGKRQVTELFGERIRVLVGQVRGTAVQQADSAGAVEDVEVEHWPEDTESTATGGDQHVPGSARQHRPKVLDPLGVVKDQQPCLSFSQLVTDRSDRRGGVGSGW
jgi:hypothetical protein